MTTPGETTTTATEVGVKELGHIVLYVKNAERSAAFYRDVLGWRQLRPANHLGNLPIALFSSGRTHHELLLIEVGEDAAALPRGRRLGMYHFGLKVGDSDDELIAMRDRLASAGVPLVGTADHGVTHSLYLTDPDGNEIELYIDVPDVSWDFDAIAGRPQALSI